MNRLFIIAFFVLSSFFVHAVGSEYIEKVLKQAIQSVNDTKAAQNQNESAASSVNSVHLTGNQSISDSQKNAHSSTSNNNQNNHVVAETHKTLFDVNSPGEIKNYLLEIDWKSWVYKLLKIIIIISLSISIWRMSNKTAQRYIKNARLFKKVSSHSSADTQVLIKTIAPIMKSVFHWILIVLTILMIISALDVDIKPLLVGFSIIGIAFAIGSQALMKDLVNGILMLFEGNIAVGEVVTVGDKTGTVESISLRALLLRHFTGELQTIPLSEVASLINCSRDYSVAIVQFVVDPKALIPSIQTALNETYQLMKIDHKFGPYIKGELSALGVKKMTEVGVTMAAGILIKPDPKKEFVSEFNRRFYERLQAYEVPLAYARV